MTNPVRNPEIELKDMGGESLLYNSKKKEVHVLNPTARLIWELCDGQHTPETIAQDIREHFSVGADKDVSQDVARTIETFQAKGLLIGD